jgi:hypothetical protein
VRGRFGPELIPDFRGAQLRSQVDVRVWPASIEPRSKQAIEQRVMNFAQLGWITPEAAMSAVYSGTAENLIEGYELDKARAFQVIQTIKDGSFITEPPRSVLPSEDAGPKLDEMGNPIPVLGPDGQPVMEAGPPGPPDPMTGQPMPGPAVPQYVKETEVPGWLPRPFDNIRVHKTVMEDWMKTTDYEMLDPPGKEAAHAYYDALLRLEAKKQAEQAQAQQDQAQAQGDFNAAKPQTAAPLPSLPGMNGSGAERNTPSSADTPPH